MKFDINKINVSDIDYFCSTVLKSGFTNSEQEEIDQIALRWPVGFDSWICENWPLLDLNQKGVLSIFLDVYWGARYYKSIKPYKEIEIKLVVEIIEVAAFFGYNTDIVDSYVFNTINICRQMNDKVKLKKARDRVENINSYYRERYKTNFDDVLVIIENQIRDKS